MGERKAVVSLFLFVLTLGLVYVLLIPPWQSPDEIHHFGYGGLLSKEKEARAEYIKNLEKEIIESMANFYAWRYLNLERPYPLPQRLHNLSYFHVITGLSGRAPLYYLVSAFIIKNLKIKGIINQFYVNRVFSFILFLLSVYFTYLSSRIIFAGNNLYNLAVVSFMGLLPQFLIISTSVNSVNLLVFFETLFIYLLLLSLHEGKKLLIALVGPLIIALGFFTHRAALFMIPPFLVLLGIFFIQSLKNRKEFLKTILILLMLGILFISLYFGAQFFFPDAFEKVVRTGGIKARVADLNNFFAYFSSASSKSLGNFVEGFFKSFWFFAGWMSFRYPLGIYSVLKFISVLSFFGIFLYLYRSLFKKNYKPSIDFNSFLILAAMGISIVMGTIVRCFPIYPVAQGRYLFPAIGAIAILFVLGLKEITPKRFERWVPIIIIIGFIVLNIYTIFNSLIRVFYYFTNA